MKSLGNVRNNIFAGIFFLVSMSACVVRPVRERPATPAVRVEVIPRAPSPRHHWQPGYYQWKRGHYVWRGGRYRR
jgi:hypothetical protein